MEISLSGWDIQTAEAAEWVPWGTTGNAKAKILGSADGYMVAFVQADAGYEGDPHVHAHPEFFYLIDGEVRNQGRPMVAGDGYAAATDSTHADFATDTGATYLVIFKI
jgi:mannose-6-phosphate isomerase-like protein (cupin superfamily)